jgi:elongation factor Ts
MKNKLTLIKKLREQTCAGVLDCKKALEKADGDFKGACEILRKQGIKLAEKKASRKTSEGAVEAYVHVNGRVGTLVEVACETDFVAKNLLFKKLCHELAMQVASMNPATVDDLLKQEYIRDPKKLVGELVKETAGKIGENIKIKRFVRFELGGT